MNRRGFLTNLFKGAAVMAAAPQIVTHGLHLRKRLVEPVRMVAVLNPDYINAPFEISWVFDTETYKGFIIESGKEFVIPSGFKEGSNIIHDPYPLRFKTADVQFNMPGAQPPIPPFILKELS